MELLKLCAFCGEIRPITFTLNSRPDLKRKYLSLSRRHALVQVIDFKICLGCSISLEERYNFVEYATSLQMELLRSGLSKVVNPQQSNTCEEIISICDSPGVRRNKNDSETIIVLDSDNELELIQESPDANLLNEKIRKRHKIRDSFVKLVDVIPSLHKGFLQMNVETANLQKKDDKTPKKKAIKKKHNLKKYRAVIKNKNRMALMDSLNLKYWCENCNFYTDVLAQFLKHVINYECTSLHCNQCKAAFNGFKGLVEHCLYHVRGELYCCIFCKFETTNRRLYLLHMSRNCNEIHYHCDETLQKKVQPKRRCTMYNC